MFVSVIFFISVIIGQVRVQMATPKKKLLLSSIFFFWGKSEVVLEHT